MSLIFSTRGYFGCIDSLAHFRPAVQIIAEYRRQFPKVFDMIASELASAMGGKFNFNVQAIGGVLVLDKLKKWLAQLDCSNLPLVPISTRSLPRLAIRGIEIASERLLQATVKKYVWHASRLDCMFAP